MSSSGPHAHENVNILGSQLDTSSPWHNSRMARIRHFIIWLLCLFVIDFECTLESSVNDTANVIIFLYTGSISAQLGSLCRLLRILHVCKMQHRFAEHFMGRLYKSSYNQPLNSHDSETSHIAKYGYSLTGPSMWMYNMYINEHLQPMEPVR